MAKQKKDVITKNDFNLQKLKLISGGTGLELEFETEEVDDPETFYNKWKLTGTQVPHKDVIEALTKLKDMFAKAHDYSFIRDVGMNPEFKASENQKKIIDKTYSEILRKIEITGVKITGKKSTEGKEGTKGCIITAAYSSHGGKKIGIVTENIKLGTVKYGFEEELEIILEDLKDEAYKYIFNNKRTKIDDGTLFEKKDAPEDTDTATETDEPKSKKSKVKEEAVA